MASASSAFNIAGQLTLRGGEEFGRQLERGGRAMQQQGKYAEQAAKSLRLFAVSLVGNRIGQALTSMGRAMVDFTKESVQMAFEWETSMRKVRTQTDLTAVQFQRISNDTLRIASKLPFAFDDVSQSLYDIYSGTRLVGTQGTQLLQMVGKAAVAGGSDISTATDAVIGAVNAYKLGIKDIPQLLDQQFQLVRKAKGDYEDFADSLNNVYPSAIRFGQGIEEVFAAIAFASKGGAASPAQAVISVARAMDQLGRSTNVAGMEEFGVAVYDANDQIRPMSHILRDLSVKMNELTAPERAKAMYDIFGVGGIQANKFLSRAIENFEGLNRHVKMFIDTTGMMQDAFDTMVRRNPQMALQILQNRVVGLRTEFAARLFPAINDIIGVFDRMLDVFDRMSPSMQDLVAKTIALAGILLLVTGRLVTFTAALAGAKSMMLLTEQTWGSISRLIIKDIGMIVVKFALIAVAIAGVVVAVRWLADHWEQARHIVIALGAIAVTVFRVQIAGALRTAGLTAAYYAVTAAMAIIPTKGLALAMRGLGLAIKAALGPFLLIFVALETLMWGLSKLAGAFETAHQAEKDLMAESPALIKAWGDVAVAAGHSRDVLADKIRREIQWLKEEGANLDEVTAARDAGKAALETYDFAMKHGLDTGRMTVKQFDKMTTAAKRQGVEVDKLAGSIRIFAGMTSAQVDKWKESVTNNFDIVGNALSELGDESKITADKFIAEMDRQLTAARRFLRNLRTLARAGLSEAAAAALAVIPQGPALVADAASKTGQALRDTTAGFNRVFREGAATQSTMADKAISIVQEMRNKNAAQLEQGGRDVERFKGQLSSIPGDKFTRIHVESDQAEADVRRLLGLISQLRAVNLPVYPGPKPSDRIDNTNWAGGTIREPVFGIGQRTGQTYSFGEKGPEDVVPRNRNTARAGGGRETHLHFHGDGYVDPEKAIAELIWYDKTHPLVRGGPS